MTFAMLFPGQGSQSVGMLSALPYPEITETLAEATQVLGWNVATLVQQGPESELNQTARTQPAVLAAAIALWRVWQREGLPKPVALAGHSLGEYTALVAAGSLAFDDALRLVELRGQLMQSAVPEGAGGMIAVIGLEDAAVEALCAQCPLDAVLAPVNYNAPGQVVVAGDAAAIEWLEVNGKAAGARMLMRLPVSVPSHCALMRSAADALAERLASVTLRAPAIPILHNIDAAPRGDVAAIREALAAQLHQPVRWTLTMSTLQAQGVSTFVECGPAKVLTGLAKRNAKGATLVALDDPAGFETARATLAV